MPQQALHELHDVTALYSECTILYYTVLYCTVQRSSRTEDQCSVAQAVSGVQETEDSSLCLVQCDISPHTEHCNETLLDKMDISNMNHMFT